MIDMLGNDLSYNNKIVNHKNCILVTYGIVHDKIVVTCLISLLNFRHISKQMAKNAFNHNDNGS